jgi:hypothetical protein
MGKCCSSRTEDNNIIDKKMQKLWSSLPIRSIDITQYANEIEDISKLHGIKYNTFEENIVNQLFLIKDNHEHNTTVKSLFTNASKQYTIDVLLFSLTFLTNTNEPSCASIAEVFLKIAKSIGSSDIYLVQNRKGDVRICANKEFLEKVVCAYVNIISELSADAVSYCETITPTSSTIETKTELSKIYQERYKDCYVMFPSDDDLCSFLQFNWKTLADDEDIRKKLLDFYNEERKKGQ